MIGTVASYENQFRKVLGAKQKAEVKKELSAKKKLLLKSESRIKELDLLFQRIYEDNVSGKISDERFGILSETYEKGQTELKQIMEELSAEISKTEEQSDNVERFISTVHKYFDLQELTPSVLNDMVKRVYVHAPQIIDGKRTQEIDIVYDFGWNTAIIITQQRRNGIENLCRFNESNITVLLRTAYAVFFCWLYKSFQN